MKCNDHCGDCPFACHTEAEDGHTPEWLIRMQDSINAMHNRLAWIKAGVMGPIPHSFIAGLVTEDRSERTAEVKPWTQMELWP